MKNFSVIMRMVEIYLLTLLIYYEYDFIIEGVDACKHINHLCIWYLNKIYTNIRFVNCIRKHLIYFALFHN